MKNLKAIKITLTTLVTALLLVQPVLASDEVTAKIGNIETLVVSIIAAFGTIILAWGAFDFFSAYQHSDTAQQTQALRRVVAGLGMCAISGILALLK
jgi:hypothetical protein